MSSSPQVLKNASRTPFSKKMADRKKNMTTIGSSPTTATTTGAENYSVGGRRSATVATGTPVREERNPNLRLKANQKNRHVVVVSDESSTSSPTSPSALTPTSPTSPHNSSATPTTPTALFLQERLSSSPTAISMVNANRLSGSIGNRNSSGGSSSGGNRSSSGFNPAFEQLQKELQQKREQNQQGGAIPIKNHNSGSGSPHPQHIYSEDDHLRRYSTSPKFTSVIWRSQQQSDQPSSPGRLLNRNASSGELKGKRSSQHSQLVLSGKSRGASPTDSNPPFTRLRRNSQLALINSMKKVSELMEKPRHRFTVKMPLSARSAPSTPQQEVIKTSDFNIDSLQHLQLQTAPQFHMTKLEQAQAEELAKIQEKKRKRSTTNDLIANQLENLQMEINMADKARQPSPEPSPRTAARTKLPINFNADRRPSVRPPVKKEFSAASLLYQYYLQQTRLKEHQQSPTNPVSTETADSSKLLSIYDNKYKNEIQLEMEMTELINRLNQFEKTVRGTILVTTIRTSDSKIRERGIYLNYQRQNEGLNLSLTDLPKDPEYDPVSEDHEVNIKVDLNAGIIVEEEEIKGNDGSSSGTAMDEENDEYENGDPIFDDDGVQVDVSNEENFLLNVNPLDKVEFISIEKFLEKCFIPASHCSDQSASDDNQQILTNQDDNNGESSAIAQSKPDNFRFYIQTLSTSFSSILHLHSMNDILDGIENILSNWETKDTVIYQQIVGRVIIMFGEWIFYGVHLMGKELMKKLLTTIEPFLQQPEYLEPGGELLERLFKLKQILYMRQRSQQNILRRVDHLSDSVNTFNILKIDMLKLSMELTLIEYDLFQMLQPQEFFSCAWMRENKQSSAPNLTAMIQCYNMVSQWVVQTILQYRDLNERYKVLCRFISLAWNCVSVRNYNGCFAIIAGLYTTSIHRLKKTWSMLNEDYTKLVEKLMFISNVSANYRNYRSELLKAKTPCIPNIAVHLKDFASLDDAQLDCADGDPHSFNVSKRHALTVLIRSLLRYQQYPFSFKSNTTLRNYLWYQLLNIMNDSETVKERSSRLLAISRELEPPPKKK